MPRAAVILFADAETPEGTGLMANALTTVSEFKDAGDEAILVFDGAGTRWIPQLTDPEFRYHRLLEQVRDRVRGASVYCARAYGVKDEIEAAGIPLERASSLSVLAASDATALALRVGDLDGPAGRPQPIADPGRPAHHLHA
ncbi:MAG: hypothetical protein M3P48_04015 [Actinomycetota bacterium]|nr:hypothetical protein [Actinomycetota bacterium]